MWRKLKHLLMRVFYRQVRRWYYWQTKSIAEVDLTAFERTDGVKEEKGTIEI